MRTSVLIATSFALGGLALMYPTLAETFDLPGRNDQPTAAAEKELNQAGLASGKVAQVEEASDARMQPASARLPARGMSMKQVELDFGAPASRKAPVGDPPITRWEYQSFIVYFEYRRVIHAVGKR